MPSFRAELTEKDGMFGWWAVCLNGNHLPVGPFEMRSDAVYYGESKGWVWEGVNA